MLFFGMKRFSDIKDLLVGDIKRLKSGDLEVYVRRSKTDQVGYGSVFHLSGSKRGGFSIPDILDWYVESVGLSVTDVLFPRFRRTRRGEVVPLKRLAVSYSASAMQLKLFCGRFGLDRLTMHSIWIGVATAAAKAGLMR